MASSGRLWPEVQALLGQQVTVYPAKSNKTNEYGEEDTEAFSRTVNCYIAVQSMADQGTTSRDVTPSHTIYCDDIDITEDDKVELPDGSSANRIDRVETFYDTEGKLYQVVTI